MELLWKIMRTDCDFAYLLLQTHAFTAQSGHDSTSVGSLAWGKIALNHLYLHYHEL